MVYYLRTYSTVYNHEYLLLENLEMADHASLALFCFSCSSNWARRPHYGSSTHTHTHTHISLVRLTSKWAGFKETYMAHAALLFKVRVGRRVIEKSVHVFHTLVVWCLKSMFSDLQIFKDLGLTC